jgi:excisionase family DNA binding protein
MPYKKLPPVTPDYMRVAEAAARLGVDRKTVRNRLLSGSMPVRVLRFDGIIRLHRQDFEQYLERASKLLSSSA